MVTEVVTNLDKCKATHFGQSLNIDNEMGSAGSKVTLETKVIAKDIAYTANDLKPAVQCEQAAAKLPKP